jgi:hypothetical protein
VGTGFPLANKREKRLRGDHAQTKSETRDNDSKKSHPAQCEFSVFHVDPSGDMMIVPESPTAMNMPFHQMISIRRLLVLEGRTVQVAPLVDWMTSPVLITPTKRLPDHAMALISLAVGDGR